MKNIGFVFTCCALLAGCVYAESPEGRFALLDLPMQTHTTVNKTVTVNAPAGTTVIVSETPIYQTPPPRCRWEPKPNPRDGFRRVCW